MEGSRVAAVGRTVREHAAVAAFLAALLVGAGLRFVPASTAAGASGASSTACAATK